MLFSAKVHHGTLSMCSCVRRMGKEMQRNGKTKSRTLRAFVILGERRTKRKGKGARLRNLLREKKSSDRWIISYKLNIREERKTVTTNTSRASLPLEVVSRRLGPQFRRFGGDSLSLSRVSKLKLENTEVKCFG